MVKRFPGLNYSGYYLIIMSTFFAIIEPNESKHIDIFKVAYRQECNQLLSWLL